MEVELKLDAAPEALDTLVEAAILREVAFAPKQLHATYYDTPDRVLHAQGLTLRIRRNGERLVQTVKAEGAAAAGLFARGEWEREVAEERPLLDAASGPVSALLPDLAAHALAPVFTVAVTRLQGVIRYEGAEIELAVDRGEIIAGEARLPVSELELELVSGPPAALFSLVRALNAAAPLRLGVEAKSTRGHALLDGRRRNKAVKAHGDVLSGTEDTAAAFAVIAAACLRHFRLNEAILLRERKAEALHQARVALRRLRSALSIFRPIVDDPRFAPLQAELRWLAATLGEARDLDVLRARGDGDLAARLEEPHVRAYAAVEEALASHRARSLMLDLIEWMALGTWRTRDEGAAERDGPAAAFAAAALDRLRRRIKHRGKGLERLDDESRHEVRIQAKKLRYAADFFRALFPGNKAQRRAAVFGEALERLQEALGELNDIAHGPHVLARLGVPPDTLPVPGNRDQLILDAAAARHDLLDAKHFWR